VIKGQNIICFGSEKWEYPGLQQTVMKLLSWENKILYVNALGIRKISIRFSQFGIYFKRAISIFQRSIDQGGEDLKNIFICNPWIIPLVYNSTVMELNKSIMRAQFSRLLSRLEFNNYILWIGTPTAAFFLDIFDPSVLIYNPVDRYSAFPFANSAKLVNYERFIASRSDAIICTADAIRKDLEQYNGNCYTVTHGVDVDHFHSVLNNNDVPEDIRNIRGPIIGYIGGLSERVDWDLLLDVAIRYPNANLVLIGKRAMDGGGEGLAKLKKQSNVHFLSYKDYKVLPDYLRTFSVCLIPYVINELLLAVDPIKLREYLAVGKPVVSVDLPEVRKLQDVVYIGKNNKDFVEKIGKAINEDNRHLTEERIRVAWRSDWRVKIEEISAIVNEAIARRQCS
jgi:glycosyltransferase involved in cell wall biosynthesis